VAQLGSAFGWGPKGRRFKSGRPDSFALRDRSRQGSTRGWKSSASRRFASGCWLRAVANVPRIELEGHSWSVWTFDEAGLITRIEIYLDHEEDEAREAAGLQE
jgi:hypothetical protein